MSYLLLPLHAFDRIVDAVTTRYARSGRLADVVGVLLLLPFVLLFVSIGVIQGALVPAEPRFAPTGSRRAFGASLPEGHEIRTGRLHHRCGVSLTALSLARRYYNHSRIFDRGKLESEFLRLNRGGFSNHGCQVGMSLVVPGGFLEPIRNTPLGWPQHREVRAVYLQGGNTVPGRVAREVAALKSAGGNAIVFDVKDILGVVNYRSEDREVEKHRTHAPPIPDLPKTIQYLHEHDVYVIARVALFQDRNLAEQRPDLAIRDGSDFLRWKGKPLWVDPGADAVHTYNLRLVAELVRLGVDEIQFDYVRYPAEGDLSRVRYRSVSSPSDKTFHLKRFLTAARALTKGTGVRTAIDVFGIVAWGERADVEATGQKLEELARYVDVVSPMLYPSHFGLVWDGIVNPADHPRHFYLHGVRRVQAKAGHRVVIRPWIQAFHWRVSQYDEKYIREQLAGSKESGGVGWMMWNAGNSYDVAYSGMQQVAP